MDKLPAGAREELRKLCLGTTTFRQIRDWLKAVHGCQTSITSLSDWWLRQQDDAMRNGTVRATDSATVFIGSFKVVARQHAGALSLTVRLAEGATGDEKEARNYQRAFCRSAASSENPQ